MISIMNNKKMKSIIKTHNSKPNGVGFERFFLTDEILEAMLKGI